MNKKHNHNNKNNRTGPPEYYIENNYKELIDLDIAEDWNKAIYHNFITLIRKGEADTKIPINCIPLYCLGWENNTWRFNRNFKQKYDHIKNELTHHISINRDIDTKRTPFTFSTLSPYTPGLDKIVRRIFLAYDIEDWKR
jgi:hypothetical protein